MRIYFGHSKSFDYVNEYYRPMEENEILQQETLIFPHKDGVNNKWCRSFYTSLDLFIKKEQSPILLYGLLPIII